MDYIDSHAHTNFDVYDDDRDAMYARAEQAGLRAIIEVGVGLEGSRAAVARAQSTPIVHAAAGLHPTGLENYPDDWAPFEELVRAGGIVAVGECGLDYYWMKSPEALQEEAFRRQIALAADVDLPFIVHCREAEEDLLRILGDAGYTRGVVHCFGGTATQAEALIALGLHISFCGNVTYKKNDGLRDAARVVPVERLLLETDSPFLAPGKKRGKRNEPSYVVETAAFLAELKGIAVEELVAAATHNTETLFSL
ncbi:MAG: TatD family hydrolase [Planctomycetota bacterium]